MVGWMSEIFLILRISFWLRYPDFGSETLFSRYAQRHKKSQHIHCEFVGIGFLFTECPEKKVIFFY